jgi:hypothetical protein
MADESAEITLNQNQASRFELVQPFKAETVATNTNTSTSTANETLEVKPLSQTLEVKPLSQSQTSNQTVDLRPVKVDNRQEIAYTDPIRTDANSTLDLKPVAMDVCVRTGQASIPPTHICEPYHHRIGLTMFGVELFGVAWSGDSQTIVEDRRSRPSVVFGDVVPAPVQQVTLPHAFHEHGGGHEHHHHEHGGHHGGPSGARGGLRIRLTG